jgi:hypothetical protein
MTLGNSHEASLQRDQRFESIPLQQRVHCKLARGRRILQPNHRLAEDAVR